MSTEAHTEDTASDKNITVRMSADLLARLDECRRRERDLPNRSEMIRRLIAEKFDERNIP